MKNNIPEPVIKSLYWWFKSTENFEMFGLVVWSIQLHGEMHWLFLIAGNGDFRALTFVPLCRLHFWSNCNELSGALEPYIRELGNLYGNIFFSWISCYWFFFLILHSDRKCAKWGETSGCKMDWICSVWYVSVVNVQKDACFGLSWSVSPIFKICIQFSEIEIFKKIVKLLFLKKMSSF